MFVSHLVSLSIAAAVFSPMLVFATTFADLQAQLTLLTEKLTALQAQTLTLPVHSATSSQQVIGAGDALCPSFTRTLARTMRGSDVSQLQHFLTYTGDYTHPEITQYFGPATENAVKKFQCANMGICSGTPYAQGYGVVGTKTRTEISKKCHAGVLPAEQTHLLPSPNAFTPASTTPRIFSTTTPVNTSTSSSSGAPISLTAYPRFSNACVRKVVGYQNEQNVLSPAPLWCLSPHAPLLISVTHESDLRTHWRVDANGSKVYDKNFVGSDAVYMHDYAETDVGKIFQLDIAPIDSTASSLGMTLDTLNYPHRVNVTGRDYRNGYLLMGLNDLSVSSLLSGDVSIDFSFRIRGREHAEYDGKKSGHRVVLGTLLGWPESGSSNGRRYLEFNLYKSPGYYVDQTQHQCPIDGKTYDYCLYDPGAGGRFTEGKSIAISAVSESGVGSTVEHNRWYTVHIPLSSFVQSSGWHNPPVNWNQARLEGLYFGIESRGSSRMSVEIKDYQIVRR